MCMQHKLVQRVAETGETWKSRDDQMISKDKDRIRSFELISRLYRREEKKAWDGTTLKQMILSFA